jgi:hypothetical protein
MKDGRWQIDDGLHELFAKLQAVVGFLNDPSLIDVAFTAPDDGWVLGRGASSPLLFHFDGTRWSLCTEMPSYTNLPRPPASCGNTARVPLTYLPTAGSTGPRPPGTAFTCTAGGSHPAPKPEAEPPAAARRFR